MDICSYGIHSWDCWSTALKAGVISTVAFGVFLLLAAIVLSRLYWNRILLNDGKRGKDDIELQIATHSAPRANRYRRQGRSVKHTSKQSPRGNSKENFSMATTLPDNWSTADNSPWASVRQNMDNVLPPPHLHFAPCVMMREIHFVPPPPPPLIAGPVLQHGHPVLPQLLPAPAIVTAPPSKTWPQDQQQEARRGRETNTFASASPGFQNMPFCIYDNGGVFKGQSPQDIGRRLTRPDALNIFRVQEPGYVDPSTSEESTVLSLDPNSEINYRPSPAYFQGDCNTVDRYSDTLYYRQSCDYKTYQQTRQPNQQISERGEGRHNEIQTTTENGSPQGPQVPNNEIHDSIQERQGQEGSKHQRRKRRWDKNKEYKEERPRQRWGNTTPLTRDKLERQDRMREAKTRKNIERSQERRELPERTRGHEPLSNIRPQHGQEVTSSRDALGTSQGATQPTENLSLTPASKYRCLSETPFSSSPSRLETYKNRRGHKRHPTTKPSHFSLRGLGSALASAIGLRGPQSDQNRRALYESIATTSGETLKSPEDKDSWSVRATRWCWSQGEDQAHPLMRKGPDHSREQERGR
jgi:hypothetical protein